MISNKKSVKNLSNNILLACLEFALSADIREELSKIDISEVNEVIHPHVYKALIEMRGETNE
ncbi:MAG: hypothetical protein ACK5L6_13605 [Anaerorhabdus sp.]|uniref:hypothetical protein n=1 Tax=Anaerorhabdus sp. TaxID=1872524 RepID=UPI003A8893C2